MTRHNNDSTSSEDSDGDGRYNNKIQQHEEQQTEVGSSASLSSHLVAADVSTPAGHPALPLHQTQSDSSLAQSRIEGLLTRIPLSNLHSANPLILPPPSHDPYVNSLLQQRFDPLLGTGLVNLAGLPFGMSNHLLINPTHAPTGAPFPYAGPFLRDHQLNQSAGGDGILSRLARAQNPLLSSLRNTGIDPAGFRLGSASSTAARSELLGSTPSSTQWPAQWLSATQGGNMARLNNALPQMTPPYYQGHAALVPPSASLPPSSTAQSENALLQQQGVASLAIPTGNRKGEQDHQLPIVGGPESFPMILHRALAELELVYGGRSIATFLPDGKSFQIKDQVRFEKQVLPIFFPKMKGFPSFQRQLNLYNFKRGAETKTERGTYFHSLFLRDFPILSSRMKRTKIKGGRPRGPPRNTESVKEGSPAHASANVDDDTNEDSKVGASRTTSDDASTSSLKDDDTTKATTAPSSSTEDPTGV